MQKSAAWGHLGGVGRPAGRLLSRLFPRECSLQAWGTGSQREPQMGSGPTGQDFNLQLQVMRSPFPWGIVHSEWQNSVLFPDFRQWGSWGPIPGSGTLSDVIRTLSSLDSLFLCLFF